MYFNHPGVLDNQWVAYPGAWAGWLSSTGMCSGIVDGVAECENPDQTTTLGAGWSGCAVCSNLYVQEYRTIVVLIFSG